MNINDYFIFEPNIAYQVKDLPHGLDFRNLISIRDEVFAQHLEHCDLAIRQSWETRKHLSFDWKNMDAVDVIAGELTELLKPLPYVEKVAIGMYHGNTLVLTVDYTTSEGNDRKVPWFYKGFTIKHVFPHEPTQ